MNGEISLSVYARDLLNQSDEHSESHAYEPYCKEVLSGNITEFVYNTLTLLERREHGVFFSGKKWARKLCEQIDVNKWKRFVDPSVGTGDLLVEVCQSLPLKSNVKKTLASWSNRLLAVDLRESFLQIAWTRIQVVAIERHREKDPKIPVFLIPLPPTFKVGDFLSEKVDIRTGDCIIMNPPYQRINAKSDSFVGKGKRSAAAFHVEHAIFEAPKGVGIVALLPDVLRSGSSYKNFRKELRQRLSIEKLESFGEFGRDADIDVAILTGVTQSPIFAEHVEEISKSAILGDRFKVSVGPVVPHRTLNSGNRHAYLTAKNCIVGSEISEPISFGNFVARLERGPFVVIRRTSSPSDKRRARATLISAQVDFLVENHLLIIKPFSGCVEHCRVLLKVLHDERTDEWLNQHIRCRHLTTGALKALPWLDEADK